jgi:iron complex outermembrane receptor protein
MSLCISPAQAQDEGAQEIEEIVTTGSRIKRDVFSSTTPIQVLDTESAARIGVASISELMQKSTAVSGAKIDGSLNANAGQTNASEAPSAGGIGSSCVNLRGLGCERTLVLINGRRLGLAGIRGAPPQPDINLIPIGMVEAVDVLTGGLSTVYGADAVAGVVNVRLKSDFEGIQFTGTTEMTDEEGGEIYQGGMVAGVGNDAGNITLGLEYSRQMRVTTGDRGFSNCLRRGIRGIGQDASGKRYTNCASDFPDDWVFIGQDLFETGELNWTGGDYTTLSGSDRNRLLYTPGSTDIGVPNYSTFLSIDPSVMTDIDGLCPTSPGCGTGNGYNRFRFTDSVGNDQYDRRIADLWRPWERFSVVTNGHVDPGWGGNSELYFEAYYFNRQNSVIAATEQVFPTILGMIPLVDESSDQPVMVNGEAVMVDNPYNPFSVDVSPILTLDSVPQTFETELQQARIVAGIRGDLFSTESWTYDVAGSYDRAVGFVKQPILLENNLYFATQTVRMQAVNGVSTGNVICGATINSDINGQFTLPDCVVADFMNPSIGNNPGISSGSFATQAEADYLVQNRTNRTVTEFKQVMAYVSGDLFELPAGAVGSAFGVEFREDAINSQNSAAGVLGLNAAENPLQEGETIGTRTTFDVYGEISAPLVVDAGFADLLQVDVAVRMTDDENFGQETVYKVGALWDINEWISVNASFNTSFRAPNLREQFLADQAGALSGNSDPCYGPGFENILDGPAKEQLRANCLLSGVDPEALGFGFTVAIPTSVGGAAALKPETSESFTSTLTLKQPWTDRFDFDIALTYFDIQIEDTVRALDAGTIVNRCYFDQPGLTSPFCDRVERNRPNSPPDQRFISFVRAGFVNTGEESVTGFDITTRLNMDIGGAAVTWATGSTLLSERLSQEFPPSEALPNGSAIVDNVGRIGNPEATFQSTLAVTMADWDLVWQARWWDDTEFPEGRANPVITGEDGLIISGGPVGADPSEVYDEFTEYAFAVDALRDPAIGPLRPVTAASGQWHHDLSLTYTMENMSVTAGINNVTNEEPPLISQEAGPNRNNAVTSARYDVIGRSYFVRVLFGF